MAKDRQEQAIYAFTLVTIIFLPLSAVASFFGMNTADIRDMEFSQWVYWAAAIPLTLSIIVLGLWWMGELNNIFEWLKRPTKLSAEGRSGGGEGGVLPVMPPSAPPPPPGVYTRNGEAISRMAHYRSTPSRPPQPGPRPMLVLGHGGSMQTRRR